MHLRVFSPSHKLIRLMAALALVACGIALSACSTVTIYEEEPETPVGQIVPSKLAIVHTAGMADSFDASDTSLGIAAVAQLSHDLKEDGYDVMLLDSGNTLASPEGLDFSDAEVPVAYLNAASYDATLASVGELGMGRDLIHQRSKQASFSLLSSNLMDSTSGEFALASTKVVKLRDGRKVGVFALTAPDDLEKIGPFEASGLEADWDDLVASAQKNVDELRDQGCLLVICLSDLDRSAEGPFGPHELAGRVSGIDFVLDVSDSQWNETRITDASDGHPLVVETPEGLSSVSVVTWERGVSGAKPIEVGTYDGSDEQVQALVTQTDIETDTQLKGELTKSSFELSSEASETGESALGDLVADAMLWTAQGGPNSTASAAIIDSASIVSGLGKGNITRADALGCCPHASTRLYAVETSGRELQSALADQFAGDQGALIQVAGMTVELANSKAAKLSIKTIGGKDFSPTATYTIVITSKALFGDTSLARLATDDLSNVTSLNTSAGKALCGYLSHKCKPTVPSSYQKPEERIAQEKADKKSD